MPQYADFPGGTNAIYICSIHLSCCCNISEKHLLFNSLSFYKQVWTILTTRCYSALANPLFFDCSHHNLGLSWSEMLQILTKHDNRSGYVHLYVRMSPHSKAETNTGTKNEQSMQKFCLSEINTRNDVYWLSELNSNKW